MMTSNDRLVAEETVHDTMVHCGLIAGVGDAERILRALEAAGFVIHRSRPMPSDDRDRLR